MFYFSWPTVYYIFGRCIDFIVFIRSIGISIGIITKYENIYVFLHSLIHIGAAGIVWSLTWCVFLANSPSKHSFISFQEVEHIQTSIEDRQGTLGYEVLLMNKCN